MPQSFAQLLVHIIFSTKDRVPLISADVRPRLYPYLGATLQASGCEPVQIGGTEDHVHIACILSKNHAPSQIIEDIKKNSSKWIKGVDRRFEGFYWQRGYGMFAVSPSHLAVLRAYISRQEEHHKKVSFQEELRRILKKYGVKCDERYMWD
jgi:REP element-mobilizing transposase RayT